MAKILKVESKSLKPGNTVMGSGKEREGGNGDNYWENDLTVDVIVRVCVCVCFLIPWNCPINRDELARLAVASFLSPGRIEYIHTLTSTSWYEFCLFLWKQIVINKELLNTFHVPSSVQGAVATTGIKADRVLAKRSETCP